MGRLDYFEDKTELSGAAGDEQLDIEFRSRL